MIGTTSCRSTGCRRSRLERLKDCAEKEGTSGGGEVDQSDAQLDAPNAPALWAAANATTNKMSNKINIIRFVCVN